MDGLKKETWMVEYGRSFFKSKCQGCGLKTCEWVCHIIIDYFNKDGSPHPINLNNSWHRMCHDQQCQHDFCVRQRAGRMFGFYIVELVKALGDMRKTVDVPKFLSSPHPMLENMSPIHIIWHDRRLGYKRVLAIIEGAASGAFV